MRSRVARPGRRLLAPLLAGAALSLAAAGCVSMPSAGPVRSYTVTQGANGQGQPYLQIVPPPPLPNATPDQIVQGFLAASASFAGQQQVAREYMTPTASRGWQPGWKTTVFKDGPVVAAIPAQAPKGDHATVVVSGDVQATLSGAGSYAVAAATPGNRPFRSELVRYSGQWRISNAYDNPLLLTVTEFQADYQLRNLYFFDPSASGQRLVPDPVYVPLQATLGDLVRQLVQDLITQPGDWLGQNATHTAFPRGTRLQGNVTVDGGTALVNLGGPLSRAPVSVREKVSAQLWWTLHDAGQGQQQVQCVALSVNGRPFVPPGAAPGDCAQTQAEAYGPAVGPAAAGYYYLDRDGQLWNSGAAGKPAKVAAIGKGYSGLAISPDGDYIAALKGGNVYTGPMGARSLVMRPTGSVITSLSWDRGDNLWAAGSVSVFLLPPPARQRQGPPAEVAVDPQGACPGSEAGNVTALRVAPDGVRVALVYGGQRPTLAFGAIVRDPQPGLAPPLVTIHLSPFSVCGKSQTFTALSWLGSDAVITLGKTGGTLTKYPVDGGTAINIPAPPGISRVTASGGKGGGLVASAAHGAMFIESDDTGTWSPLPPGLSPAFPG
jgi:hypothetical protein